MLTEADFNDLYKNGYARACSIFRKQGLEPDQCDDVAQDMYERMWRYRHQCTETYKPLTFWFLNLRYAISNIVPAYKREGTYILTNSDALEFLQDHYPDPADPELQLMLESFLETLPEELAQDILAKYSSVTQQDAYELLDSLGLRPQGKESKAYMMRIKRLKEDPDIQRMIQEFTGRN